MFQILFLSDIQHGGELHGMKDRGHGISCRCPDKTGKEIDHIFLYTQFIFMQ